MMGSGAGGISGTYASKFNATSFGQSLLKNAAAKENSGVTGSQVFGAGFSKFISDGGALGQATAGHTDKPDPHTLPMPFKDSTINGARFGSAFNHIKNTSSGANSFKSSQNNQTTTSALSADETNSNKE